MRAYTVLVTVIIMATLLAVQAYSADEFSEYIPSYFVSPSLAPVVAKNVENGRGVVTYSVYTETAEYDPDLSNPDTNDYQWHYYYKLKSDNYAGYLGGVSHYPAIKFTIRLQGYGEITGSFAGAPYQLYIVPGTTILSLYHAGDTDELMAWFEVYASAPVGSTGSYTYVSTLRFVHRKYNMTTGNYTDTILYQEARDLSSLPGTPAYIIISMTIVPVFYDWYNPDDGSHYLTFGFKGYYNVYTPEATITGSEFSFAWKTYNIGPRANATLQDVSGFVEETRGWYVWVGAGLRYYRPYSSIHEVYPEPENSYSSTSIVYSANKTLGEVINDVDVHVSLDIYVSDITIYNYIVDVQRLYSLFVYGGLENYREAYLRHGNITVIAGNYEETVNLMKPLLPLVIPLVILFPFLRDEKISRTVVVTAYMVMAVALGVGMGIFGVSELVSIILVFVSVHVIKSRSPGPDEARG